MRPQDEMCIRDRSLIPDFGLNKLFQTNSTTIAIFLAAAVAAVSYTHLDVYKRQGLFHRGKPLCCIMNKKGEIIYVYPSHQRRNGRFRHGTFPILI